MNDTDTSQKNIAAQDKFRIRILGIIRGMIPVILMAAVLSMSAGTFVWRAAWAVIGVALVATVIVLATCHAGLVVERTTEQKGVKEYDKYLVRILCITGIFVLLVAGLDSRFGWSGPVTFPVQVLAFIVYVLGYCLFSWAMISNRFFSLIARIQSEKGHHPVIAGPYQFIRHPGYLGFIIYDLALPFVLGSFWAIIPAIAAAGILLKRTDLEDGMLILELEGYEEYASIVKYRLVPGVW